MQMMMMMSHHKPPPFRSNRIHHTGTGGAGEEPMTHRHRAAAAADDDDGDGMRPIIFHLQHNIIARLMGIDAAAVPVPLPPPKATSSSPTPTTTAVASSSSPNKLRQSKCNATTEDPSPTPLCLHGMTMRVAGSGGWRPRRRRRRRSRPHPQEDLLEKMRQDLRAWQAAKAPPTATLETASGATAAASASARPSDSDGGGWSSISLQAIAREDLRRQKMARYGLGLGRRGSKVTTQQDDLPLIKNENEENGGVARGEGDPPPSSESPDEEESRGLQELPGRHRRTPIVLLKPAAAACSESDDSSTTGGVAIGGGQKTESLLPGLPRLSRDAGMSALLEEVKGRVQRELTVLSAAAATGCGGELVVKAPRAIPLPFPPQQQATSEDEDRGSTKRRLFRSESFRAFRRDHRKRSASTPPPGFKSQTAASPEKADEQSMASDAPLSPALRPGVGGVVTDGQSFRSECLLTTRHRDDDDASPSPRVLSRSFSAPEPGLGAFSLGRLFSFSWQHGASEPPAAAAAAVTTVTSRSVGSAAGFSSFIRGTVSSLRRHGFSSRRKTKTHWFWSNRKTSLGAAEIHPAEMEMEMPIVCAATTPPSPETRNLFKVAQANLSELPPSPLEVGAGGHSSSRHFFTHLHFTLPSAELSPKSLSELEPPATASASASSSFRTTDITAAVETAACSRDKAYITELLIAAGLYDADGDEGPSAATARVDSMARRPVPVPPMCDDVFEDVEDLYYYRGDDYTVVVAGGGTCNANDHRMLFDLANEALQSLAAAETSRPRGGCSSSSLRRWVVVDGTGVARGKKLVDDVWRQVQALRNRPQQQQTQGMQTIDGMVANEVRRSAWAAEEVLYEDVYVVGRKIERAIFDELIEDLFACAGGLST